MATYLLTWSPQKWAWVDLQDYISEIARRGYCLSDWSCGNTKGIVRGDRVFLLRQGREPRGICGSGHADSDVYEAAHWDENKAKSGKVTRYIKVRWDVLLNPENESIFPREWLNEPPLSKVNWNTQVSGIKIADGVAGELEERWSDFLDSRKRRFSLFGWKSP